MHSGPGRAAAADAMIYIVLPVMEQGPSTGRVTREERLFFPGRNGPGPGPPGRPARRRLAGRSRLGPPAGGHSRLFCHGVGPAGLNALEAPPALTSGSPRAPDVNLRPSSFKFISRLRPGCFCTSSARAFQLASPPRTVTRTSARGAPPSPWSRYTRGTYHPAAAVRRLPVTP
jgi:hypothetical protein